MLLWFRLEWCSLRECVVSTKIRWSLAGARNVFIHSHGLWGDEAILCCAVCVMYVCVVSVRCVCVYATALARSSHFPYAAMCACIHCWHYAAACSVRIISYMRTQSHWLCEMCITNEFAFDAAYMYVTDGLWVCVNARDRPMVHFIRTIPRQCYAMRIPAQ